MLKVIWKICLVLAAVLIAAFITCLPWTRLDELPGNEGYAYFLLSIVWAPIALLAGLFAGAMFAFMLWPKRPGNPRAKDPRHLHAPSRRVPSSRHDSPFKPTLLAARIAPGVRPGQERT
jgi:hypothetical protein